MPEPVREYYLAEMTDVAHVTKAIGQLLRAHGTPEGMHLVALGPRPVVWVADLLRREPPVAGSALYVSEGAYSLAHLAGIELPRGPKIAAADLPIARTLILGDQRDWEDTRSRH